MSTDIVDIKVSTPLPSNVVLTLGALIDAAWPGSQLATNEDRHTQQIVYRINNARANRNAVDEEHAAALHLGPAADDTDITALGPEGVSMLTPLDVAANLLSVIQGAFEEFPDAENYLEMPIRDPSDGHRYLLTFCRSRAQTPHELRLHAEKELTDARGRIHREYAAALWGLRTAPRGSDHEDSYEAGVKAALDVVRRLGFPYNDTGGDDGEGMSADE